MEPAESEASLLRSKIAEYEQRIKGLEDQARELAEIEGPLLRALSLLNSRYRAALRQHKPASPHLARKEPAARHSAKRDIS
jgi:hypothetical protein